LLGKAIKDGTLTPEQAVEKARSAGWVKVKQLRDFVADDPGRIADDEERGKAGADDLHAEIVIKQDNGGGKRNRRRK